MGLLRALLISTVAATAAATSAQAGVAVSFNQPETYTDAGLHGPYSPTSRQATLKELQKYFESLATRYLPPGQNLMVDIDDIDLAGEYDPASAGAYNARVLNDLTWPRIVLRYTLEKGGVPVVSTAETVSEINYLLHADRLRPGDTLHYEKLMLDKWFKARFADGKLATN